jgi:hypothetical protein
MTKVFDNVNSVYFSSISKENGRLTTDSVTREVGKECGSTAVKCGDEQDRVGRLKNVIQMSE